LTQNRKSNSKVMIKVNIKSKTIKNLLLFSGTGKWLAMSLCLTKQNLSYLETQNANSPSWEKVRCPFVQFTQSSKPGFINSMTNELTMIPWESKQIYIYTHSILPSKYLETAYLVKPACWSSFSHILS
jgi:hypothetical protein